MDRPLDDEVREYGFRVLTGAITVSEFEDWFVGRTWDDRSELVAEVDHLLAERAVMSPLAFEDALRTLVETIDATLPRSTRSGASATTLEVNGHLEFAGR